MVAITLRVANTSKRAELHFSEFSSTHCKSMQKKHFEDFVEISEMDTPFYHHQQNEINPVEPRTTCKISKNSIFDVDWNISKPGSFYLM